MKTRKRTSGLRALQLYTPIDSNLSYARLSVPPGAFAATRGTHARRAPPREKAREQLRLSVWEAEGGSLPVRAPVGVDPSVTPLIRR